MPPVDPARWRELSALLDAALDLDPGGARRSRGVSARGHARPRGVARRSSRRAAPGVAEALPRSGPDLPELPFPVSGQTIGAYTLDRPLGAGGMGAVWLGRRSDGRFEGQVAIKLLNLALLDERGQARFRREGTRAGASLTSEYRAAARCRRERERPAVSRARIRRRPAD